MAKSPLEKQFDKMQRETKKAEQRQIIQNRAAAIVSSQPEVNGIRILDETAETVLKALLEKCTSKETGHVSFTLDIFPTAVAHSIRLEIEKLINYGMVSSYIPWDSGGMLDLLPCAFTYFDRKEKAYSQNTEKETGQNKLIFISHRSTDKVIADRLTDFLSNVGISKSLVFCSSLPGNDVNEKISSEVRDALRNSVVNIMILSRDYYQSAYCLNEAGIIWFQEKVLAIPIALPEIDTSNMYGFINNDYKLRRLDCDTDISYGSFSVIHPPAMPVSIKEL